MGGEKLADGFGAEGVGDHDGGHGPGRVGRPHGGRRHPGLDLGQGVRQSFRILGQLAAVFVRVVLAGAGDGHLNQRGANGGQDHGQQGAQRIGSAAVIIPAATEVHEGITQVSDDHGHGGGDGRSEDVMVIDMHELMAQDAADLAIVEHLQDPLGTADRRVPLVAAGREGVGRHGRGDVNLRHGFAGLGGQLAHDGIEIGRLLLRDLASAHGGGGQPVREPVGAKGHDHGDDQIIDQGGLASPGQIPNQEDDRPHKPEENDGLQPVSVTVHMEFLIAHRRSPISQSVLNQSMSDLASVSRLALASFSTPVLASVSTLVSAPV